MVYESVLHGKNEDNQCQDGRKMEWQSAKGPHDHVKPENKRQWVS